MKIEVVYYSATGNTKNVAEKIVQITGGDIFEIEPTEPYTDDDSVVIFLNIVKCYKNQF